MVEEGEAVLTVVGVAVGTLGAEEVAVVVVVEKDDMLIDYKDQEMDR
jgi:hypothetical protein